MDECKQCNDTGLMGNLGQFPFEDVECDQCMKGMKMYRKNAENKFAAVLAVLDARIADYEKKLSFSASTKEPEEDEQIIFVSKINALRELRAEIVGIRKEVG